MGKLIKIVDPEVLKTIKLKDIIEPVYKKYTEEEGSALKLLTDGDEKRAKAIELYNKYIDEVIGKDTDPAITTPPANPPSSGSVSSDGSTSTLTDDAPSAANLTNTYAVEIRRVPNYNGLVTMPADKLIGLIMKNQHGLFKFKSEARAQMVIKTISGVKTLKGMYNITDEKRKTAIATVKRSNNIK